MNKSASIYEYAYGVGKVRAMERHLIKDEVFMESVSLDLKDALRLFAETGIFQEGLGKINTSDELEKVLKNEKENLDNLASKLLVDKELIFLLDATDLIRAKRVSLSYNFKLLQDFIMHMIDMNNIKTFLRNFVFKDSLDKLRSVITESGFINKNDFFSVYDKELSFFLAKLEFVHRRYSIVDYTLFLKDAIKLIEEKKSFIALEKAIAGFLIEVLRPAKYLCFGPEAILAYYYARINEINLVRLIVLAKLNDLDNSIIKQRLNRTYA